MVADVASDADPDTGLAIYDSYDGYGWIIVGGTSAASPFLAGVIALAGNPGAFPNASYLYKHASRLYDITKGTNVTAPSGDHCGGDYLCNAKPGYDGPTGNGTPHGTGAF
jgi:subtilase family serine protease